MYHKLVIFAFHFFLVLSSFHFLSSAVVPRHRRRSRLPCRSRAITLSKHALFLLLPGHVVVEHAPYLLLLLHALFLLAEAVVTRHGRGRL